MDRATAETVSRSAGLYVPGLIVSETDAQPSRAGVKRSGTRSGPARGAHRDAEIGLRIRTLRRARGWTQERLAAACDVTRSAIAQWESGRAAPQAVNLAAVAEAMSVSVEALRYGGQLADEPELSGDEVALLSLFRRSSSEQRACLLTVARTLGGKIRGSNAASAFGNDEAEAA